MEEVIDNNLQNTEDDEIVYEEGYTSLEVINGVYFALASLGDVDIAMASNADKQRINRIKKKSIKMLDWAVTDMYDSIFDDEGNED
jgi:hypothetical protein